MTGNRDSSSTQPQQICLVSSTTPLSEQQEAHVQRLLCQTIFAPKTNLELDLSIPPISPNSPPDATPYIYALLRSLLQDPYLIQFPCTLAILHPTNPKHHQQQQTECPLKPHPTLGCIILTVLEDLFLVLHQLLVRTRSERGDNNNHHHLFDQHVLQPLRVSLLAQLLGNGGSLLEDLTMNRTVDVLPRLHHRRQTNATDDETIWRQRWILEPILTRAALSEWQFITERSPYPSTVATTTHELRHQIRKDTIQYGLGFVLQLGRMLQMEPKQLALLEWVVESCCWTDDSGATSKQEEPISAIPLEDWGIKTMQDLNDFLARSAAFGRHSVSVPAPLSRL
ncbi:expressed unknown protein [Seminavis robusta]|uniref:Uncharacterized protein n=1 Tax=Seminavis robusta TaxID=568900 RepID=A0A9N8F293_9STRA|nr:expressed unknown protein [Seminavis robusta]|eukprot:Sro2393_g325840.1 n/a (339) ;mRNA; r:6289-7305